MKYRKKLSRYKSKKVFRKGAKNFHRKNLTQTVMRGGIRL